MTTVQTTTAPGIEETDEKDDDFVEVVDWTKNRHKLNITGAEFDAEILRLQALHPERGLSREELDAKIMRLQEARTVERHAEAVGA